MENKDWIMLLAIILGPILAVQTQKIIESIIEKRNRKKQIFHTLMATRASRVSHMHVEALNMIDIVFYGKSIFGKRFPSKGDKAITDAWKKYYDLLSNKNSYASEEIWAQKGNEYFDELLFIMSKNLKYDFDEVVIKRNCYSPEAHGKQELDNLIIRRGIAEVFGNNRPIPIQIIENKDHIIVSTDEIIKTEQIINQ